MANKTAPPKGREPPRLRRRWRVNLALLVVVIALAAFTAYKHQQAKIESKRPLATLAVENIDRIRIERPGQPAIVLENTAGSWRLTAPVAARANRFNVESLLRAVSTHSEVILEDNDPVRYGLVTPQAIVEIGAERIEFGATHPFRSQVYVRHRDTVHLVGAQVLGAVLRPPSHFIDARLLEPEHRLVGLRLPGFTLDLKEGHWQRHPPVKDLVSDRLSDFVARWTHAQALAVEPATARPALAALRLVRARENAKSETLTLEILAYKPTFVLRRRDEKLEYHFPEEIGKRLLDVGNDG